MGSSLSQLDWVALSVALIAYPLALVIAGAWTARLARKMYRAWREKLGWFIALRGWLWMPLLFATGSLAASGLFLYWRNSFPVDPRIQRDLIMGFTITNVFFYHMWSPALLWGPTYWFMASAYAFCMAASATGVLIVMGISRAWLPFALYFAYPAFAWFLTFVTVLFWWHAGDMTNVARRFRESMRRGADVPGRAVDALMGAIDAPLPRKPYRANVRQPQREYVYAYN